MGISERLPGCPSQSKALIHRLLGVNSPLLPPASLCLSLFLSVLVWFSVPASHCPSSHPHGILLVNLLTQVSQRQIVRSVCSTCGISFYVGQFLFFRLYWTFTISLVEGEKLGFRCSKFLLYGSSPCFSCGQNGWGVGYASETSLNVSLFPFVLSLIMTKRD